MSVITNHQRFVLASRILQDVPGTDYLAQAHAIVNELSVAALPAIVREAETAYPNFFFPTHSVENAPNGFGYPSFMAEVDLAKHPRERKKIEALCAKHLAQKKKRDELSSEVRAALRSVRTEKQLRERFPDWAKYLPDAPAVKPGKALSTDVIKHLKKAGWKA